MDANAQDTVGAVSTFACEPQGQAGKGEVGAVAYLNMLPYFARNAAILCAPSPRALNTAARQGEVQFACLSAVAGLRAGYRPVAPFLGIGSRGGVQSVYLEVILGAENQGFWERWHAQNLGGIGRLPGPIGGHAVHLFTSGASEHSEWLFSVLLAAQGFKPCVHRVPRAWNHRSPEELRQSAVQEVGNEPCAFLIIGDPALERALLFPQNPEILRFDLGTTWQAFSGTPCIFAVWYDVRRGHPPGTSSAEVGAMLHEAICAWQTLSDDEKWREASDFLLTTGSPIVAHMRKKGASARDYILTYLDGISFQFDEEFSLTFSYYQKLWELFPL